MAVPLTSAQLEALQPLRPITDGTEISLWLMRGPADQTVALKVMPTPWHAITLRTLFLQRLSHLERIAHPRLMPILGGRLRGNRCIVVTELAERGSLYDAFAPGERRIWTLPFAPREAVRLIAEVAEGLGALHHAHALHGGVKPTNVLLSMGSDGQWHVRITDAVLHLGLRGYQSPGFARRPTGIADPFQYVAPEQFQQHPSHASDQFALAAIAYVLLTGFPPWPGDPLDALRQEHVRILPANLHNPALSGAVEAVLERGLHRQPRQRYRSVIEFALALRQAVQAPDVARSMSLEGVSSPTVTIPTQGSAAQRQPQTRHTHELVTVPRPLATLGNTLQPDVLGLPDLPPNYNWTQDALFSVPPPAAITVRKITPRPLSPLITRVLIAAIVLIGLGVISIVLAWLSLTLH